MLLARKISVCNVWKIIYAVIVVTKKHFLLNGFILNFSFESICISSKVLSAHKGSALQCVDKWCISKISCKY